MDQRPRDADPNPLETEIICRIRIRIRIKKKVGSGCDPLKALIPILQKVVIRS